MALPVWAAMVATAATAVAVTSSSAEDPAVRVALAVRVRCLLLTAEVAVTVVAAVMVALGQVVAPGALVEKVVRLAPPAVVIRVREDLEVLLQVTAATGMDVSAAAAQALAEQYLLEKQAP